MCVSVAGLKPRVWAGVCVRPMHARAVGVAAPGPGRGYASTSSAVRGRRSEGARPTEDHPRRRGRPGWAAARKARSGGGNPVEIPSDIFLFILS